MTSFSRLEPGNEDETSEQSRDLLPVVFTFSVKIFTCAASLISNILGDSFKKAFGFVHVVSGGCKEVHCGVSEYLISAVRAVIARYAEAASREV